MRFLVVSSSVYIFFLFNFLNGRDDGYIDTTFNDSKNIFLTSIKETTGYNSKISKNPLFNQNISLPEVINYIYEAKAGDNLEKIAEKLGVTENQIRKWNNLKEEDVHIYVGKKFTIWMPNDSSNVSLTHFGERQIRHNAMMEKPDLFYFKDEFESSKEYKERKNQQKEFIELSKNNLIAEKLIEKLNKERQAKEEKVLSIKSKEKNIITSLSKVEGSLISIGDYDADTEMFDSILVQFGSTYIYEDLKVFGYGSRLYGTIGETSFGSKYFQNFMEMNLYGSINGATMRIGDDMIYQLKKPEMLYVKEEYLGEDKDIIKVALNEPVKLEVFRENFIKERAYYRISLERDAAKELKRKFRFAKVEGYRRLNQDAQHFEYFNLVLIHPTNGTRLSFGPTKNIDGLEVYSGDKPSGRPEIKMTSIFMEQNGNGFLDPGEKAKIKLIIDNIGDGPAVGLSLNIQNQIFNDGIIFPEFKVVGTILAGKSKELIIDLEAKKELREARNIIEVSATESYGYYPKPSLIQFETSAFLLPELMLTDFGVETNNTGNAIIEGKPAIVQVRVQNRGLGLVENVSFDITLPKDVYFQKDSKRSYDFSMLKPGEFRDLEFSFLPEKNMPKNLNIAISFDEKNSSGTLEFNIETNKPLGNIKYFNMRGRLASKKDLFGKRPIRLVDVESDVPNFGRNGQADMAVILGLENYKTLSGVEFAKRDAYWIRRYFQRVLGIPSENIFYKIDTEVDKNTFNEVFGDEGWLNEKIKRGQSNVFVYFAGKGASDSYTNTAYLVPYDGNPKDITSTGYKLNTMYDQLANFGASSVTIFLDACFTGIARSRDLNLIDTAPIIFDKSKYEGKNFSVFFATTDMETSASLPSKKHGLFSYYLMKGLRGRADLNRDKRLTVKEIGKYLERNIPIVANMYDAQQTPNMKTSNDKTVLIRF